MKLCKTIVLRLAPKPVTRTLRFILLICSPLCKPFNKQDKGSWHIEGKRKAGSSPKAI